MLPGVFLISALVVFGFASRALAHTIGDQPSSAVRSAWVVYLIATFALSRADWLAIYEPVPVMLPLFWVGLAGVGWTLWRISRELWSTRILPTLIALQTFRIGVELLIHQAVANGIAPPQLTWTGLNFDLLTGLSAPLVAFAVARGVLPLALVRAWNFGTLALLLLVVGTSVLSMPGPLQRMTPDNTWITGVPYFLLPTVFVLVALVLHGWIELAVRRLRRERAATG